MWWKAPPSLWLGWVRFLSQMMNTRQKKSVLDFSNIKMLESSLSCCTVLSQYKRQLNHPVEWWINTACTTAFTFGIQSCTEDVFLSSLFLSEESFSLVEKVVSYSAQRELLATVLKLSLMLWGSGHVRQWYFPWLAFELAATYYMT